MRHFDDPPSVSEAMFVFGWMTDADPNEIDQARAAYKRSQKGG